ncbi:MAG: DNA-binding protein [Candidatus Omnitrophica bacterium]|nr:DNA-binding protein [Candidatus Omnitrophota bacterium]
MITTLIHIILMIVLFSFSGFAQSVSSEQLIKEAQQYDKKTILYQGEVIGDIMLRKDHAWINLHDGGFAIGVWVDRDLITQINYTGGYKYKGDWIEVKGIFNRACLEHGGDMDIHAQQLKKIKSGELVKEKTDVYKEELALMGAGLLCLILILTRSKRQLRQS